MKKVDDLNIATHGLSKKEKQNADQELLQFRQSRLRNSSDQDTLYARILQFRYNLEDDLSKPETDNSKSLYFGSLLSEYIKILDRKHQDFAEEINLHPTKLSRIINDRDEPKKYLFYRLEKHSGHTIPAEIWWKSFMKQKERSLNADIKTRKKEEAMVKNELHFSV